MSAPRRKKGREKAGGLFDSLHSALGEKEKKRKRKKKKGPDVPGRQSIRGKKEKEELTPPTAGRVKARSQDIRTGMLQIKRGKEKRKREGGEF